MMNVRIQGTGSALPGRRRTTAEVVAEAWPARDPDEMTRRLGISHRHWVGPDESDAALASEALGRALAAARCQAGELRRLILVTSTGGDHLHPATANDVAARLGIDDSCDAFDLNNACNGFLTALDLAARSVVTGLSPVGVVAVETFSRYLTPRLPRPYVVMGDAAAGLVLGTGAEGEGILASFLRNSGHLRGRMNAPHPARTGQPGTIEFGASSDELTAGAVRALATGARAVLEASGCGFGDVAWFIPHQANARIASELMPLLPMPADRVLSTLDAVGSIGAASIPYTLDRLMSTGGLRAGDRLLMSAVGAGTAYGAILYRHGA
jgi:3-oxoacyl-(acyl-carrier-protein) synthase III